MSLATAQNPFTTSRSPSQIPRNPIKFKAHPPFNPPTSPSLLSQPQRHAAFHQRGAVLSSSSPRWLTGAFVSGEGVDLSPPRGDVDQLSFDAVLSVAEVLFVAPPAIYSIGCLVGLVLPGGPKLFQVPPGSRIFIWQIFLLAGAVVIGGLIRRRQWQRLCRANTRGSGVDLIGRIEKVEEDLRSSTTIVRVLSRQLEKLGIRFRVTRKALKEPIAETAALAQKNSEATRALAVHEDILEKELSEIQKVLLAMQEQQQKQLELILAIGKAGRLFESKRDASAAGQAPIGGSDSLPEKKLATPLEFQTESNTGSNDRV